RGVAGAASAREGRRTSEHGAPELDLPGRGDAGIPLVSHLQAVTGLFPRSQDIVGRRRLDGALTAHTPQAPLARLAPVPPLVAFPAGGVRTTARRASRVPARVACRTSGSPCTRAAAFGSTGERHGPSHDQERTTEASKSHLVSHPFRVCVVTVRVVAAIPHDDERKWYRPAGPAREGQGGTPAPRMPMPPPFVHQRARGCTCDDDASVRGAVPAQPSLDAPMASGGAAELDLSSGSRLPRARPRSPTASRRRPSFFTASSPTRSDVSSSIAARPYGRR